MKFEGEHLLPGQIGQFFILLAFVASILSTISYFIASKKNDPAERNSWLKYARGTFLTQLVSVLVIFAIIFYICSNHYFEYLYAYKHASKELESKYLLACIWEGQEGSFLLWTIWHSILGVFIMLRSKEWEAPVMSVIVAKSSPTLAKALRMRTCQSGRCARTCRTQEPALAVVS